MRFQNTHESLCHQLTLLHTWCDGNEGHEAAEAQVDPQQGLVEVAGDGVCVVLVHESEGHGGDGVEEECGAHHCQIPALVFCCSGQPDKNMCECFQPNTTAVEKTQHKECNCQCEN